jgi:ATP:ADP antiporter, AAA family
MSDPKTLLKYPEPPSQISFPLFKTEGEQPKNAVEKLLCLFADVRAGEGVSALLMGLNVFLLLAGYYLLKTAREALILPGAGAKNEAYLAAAQALLLVGVIPLYG